jgi:hypothetical protein
VLSQINPPTPTYPPTHTHTPTLTHTPTPTLLNIRFHHSKPCDENRRGPQTRQTHPHSLEETLNLVSELIYVFIKRVKATTEASRKKSMGRIDID